MRGSTENQLIVSGIILFLAFVPVKAFADLIDRGVFPVSGGPHNVTLIYDTDRDLTWVGDANFSQTSGFDADGLMTWNQAVAWVSGLNIQGFKDWRLPSALNQDGSGPCAGSNCYDSELGHLFAPVASGGEGISLATPGLFSNIQSMNYWTGTESPPQLVWNFSPITGIQGTTGKDNSCECDFTWVVRDGDVLKGNPNGGVQNVEATFSTPEPPTIVLFGSCLAGLGWWGYRKQKTV